MYHMFVVLCAISFVCVPSRSTYALRTIVSNSLMKASVCCVGTVRIR